jgi:hypothetical protein
MRAVRLVWYPLLHRPALLALSSATLASSVAGTSARHRSLSFRAIQPVHTGRRRSICYVDPKVCFDMPVERSKRNKDTKDEDGSELTCCAAALTKGNNCCSTEKKASGCCRPESSDTKCCMATEEKGSDHDTVAAELAGVDLNE